ncbi:glycoside hydrolase family 95 protein [Pedobacter frigiditerrae]|uniref:Glycoside hydrolase family 95 protein n=1 Tax=Pedobacter frigiditerrae TaxID=2530452 RepID=A0A4R0MS99_9SPHI|nr:glycoside hydrolase family 95 protein [Pedobacter frigiditerrae]TCC89082.1 glycoside hydrolase family 95 protein [Pedobacter frigiditerrae]
MNRLLFLILFFCAFNASSQNVQTPADLKLWYNRPASVWEEALPLGNGKTGAMVFGGIKKERYQLNDNTLWSGYPISGNNPDGPTVLPQVRKAIYEGDYNKAAILWRKMQGPYSARYLPLGDLLINYDLKDTVATTYCRDLNLHDALSTVRYKVGNITYSRETLVSFPDKMMVVHLTADQKGALNFTVGLSSLLRFKTSTNADDYLLLKGKAPKHVANRDYEPFQVAYDEDPKGEGMNFEIHVKVKLDGGSVKANGDQLTIKNANSVTLYLSEATSFNGFDKSPGFEGKDPAVEAKSKLQNAFVKSFAQIKATHKNDYQQLFNRVVFNLDGNQELVKYPTNERLLNFKENKNDHQLQVLYYQFGRYLMIASSRPGSRPTNLQGIWNDKIIPPWGSNYTTNINTEMNYWLAENTNLSECHQPLFDFMKELAVNGAKTAKVNYAIKEGWTAHHNSDLWAKTSPPGGYDWDPKGAPRWSAWPMAGGWLSTHLWEHYLYTGDKAFLGKDAYPLMKGAAQFLLNWLIKDTKSGYLITNPSTSPENTVKIQGKEYQLSLASTMDMSIIRELFNDCIKATRVLNIDAEFRAKLETAKSKLYPYHIGKYGQLQEWYGDWDDPKDTHRHISHLFGLFPGNQISVLQTPELAAAAKQTLIHRGDISTGWSMAWKINWWARMKDGNHAYEILNTAFNYIDPTQNKAQMSGGGTYPNLFDAHPPFQIDGNFGGTAGITEMLMQSHEGEISLLPALPDAWPNGKIKGIKARGNFEIDITWEKGKLSTAKIKSIIGGHCRLRTPIPVKLVEVAIANGGGNTSNALMPNFEQTPYQNQTKAKLQVLKANNGYTINFKTEKGKSYTIVPIK